MEKVWHKKRKEEILQIFYTSEQGLSEREARDRLKKFGFNEIVERKKVNPLLIFLGQFKNFLIIILLVASFVSFLAGRKDDAILISTILLLNALIGFFQEYKAEKAMEALKKLLVPKTKVIREGKQKTIPSRELVPGDIILLEEGDKVPADCRLIEVFNLKVDESSLTGESIPVEKHDRVLGDVAIPERKNMVFMGTVVTSGKAKAVVVDTGIHTELGMIASIVEKKEEETPLQIRLTQFGKWIGVFILIISLFVFLIGIVRKIEISQMFLTAVALAVSAVPEGLPVTITVALALGVHTMAKRNAIVRKLSAVETLGCTTVIVADKTGTMTTNEMTVRKIFIGDKKIEVTGIGFEPHGEFLFEGKPYFDENLELLLRACVLCNSASFFREGDKWKISGDPTEVALLVAAAKKGMLKEEMQKKFKTLVEIPFSSERKMMSVLASDGEKVLAYVKGAPEKVLEASTKIKKESVKVLEKEEKARIEREIRKMASEGLRVIGVAYKKVESKEFSPEKVEKDLVFLGLIGMQDPPRKEVKEAIEKCKAAGIKVVMVTGDHKETAVSVAKELGILEGLVLTGSELDKMSDEDLEKIVEKVSVYARVSPEHKFRIVRALKKVGHIVAVTGDGANDAPALKEADVGVSMGIRGTDVAREASDIVLADDNFYSIVSAVEEGRAIYDNIRKFIRFMLSVNFNEIFITSLAILAGLPLPLLPLQILWINLLTDSLPALALVFDPKDPEIMKRKPRNPKESILHGMKLFILAAGSLACLATIASFVFGFITAGVEKGRTMALTTAVLFQLLFVFNCRSEKNPVFKTKVFSNKYLVLSVLAALFLQLIIVFVPFFNTLFSTVPLTSTELLIVLLLSSSGLLLFPNIFMS